MQGKWKFAFEHILLTVTSIGQILIAVFTYHRPVDPIIRNGGWIILWIAGIFGVLPILTMKKYGSVEKGKSYIHTNVLIDQGVFSLVRHPQYLAGILISIGLLLIAPGWVNLFFGVVNIMQYYKGSFEEEKGLVEQFGQAYIDYQRKVPRYNFLWGAIKKIVRRVA